MLVHNDRIALGGVRGDKFIFGAIRGDKQLFDTSVITDANKEYIIATYGEEALAKALVYLHGNPSFIPFFNEDPDTICSVCEIGWIRGNPQIIPLYYFNPTKKTVIKCWMIDTDQSNRESLFGVYNGASESNKSYSFSMMNTNGSWWNNGKNISGYYSDCGVNTPYSIDYQWGKVLIQNLKTGNKAEYDTQVTDDYIPTNIGFAINGAIDRVGNQTVCYLNNFEIYEDGVKLYHFIPFKRGDLFVHINMMTCEVVLAVNNIKTEVRKKINE